VVPLVSGGLTAIALALSGVTWRHKTGTAAWRAYRVLVVLLPIIFLLVPDAWNLIGSKLN